MRKTIPANDTPEAEKLRRKALDFARPGVEGDVFDSLGHRRNAALLKAAREYARLANAYDGQEQSLVDALKKEIMDLTEARNKLQSTNAQLWHERNAAIEGGWSSVKAIYASRQARENDRLRSELLSLKNKIQEALR